MGNGLLDGKVALVTGASRGIGAAVRRTLQRRRRPVAVVARTHDEHPQLGGSLSETLARCRSHGATAEMIVADLADVDDEHVVAEASQLLGGPLDILVNNAAASIYRPIADYQLDQLRETFEVNLNAPLGLIQAASPACWITKPAGSSTSRAPPQITTSALPARLRDRAA